MISPISNTHQSFSLRLSIRARRALNPIGSAVVLGLMVSTAALTPAVRAQTLVPAYHAAADSAYVAGHMYLNNADGTVADVTDSYMQIGIVYDAQKGYTVQTGYVVDATGNGIDVTVDINQGEIEGWGGRSIGFIAPQMAQPSS